MAHDKACVDSNARILPKHPVIGVQVKSHQETRDVGTRHGGSQSQEKWGGGSGNLSLAYNSGNPLCQLVMTTAVLSFIIIVIISGSGSMASTSMQLPTCWLRPKPRLTCPYWTLMKSQCRGDYNNPLWQLRHFLLYLPTVLWSNDGELVWPTLQGTESFWRTEAGFSFLRITRSSTWRTVNSFLKNFLFIFLANPLQGMWNLSSLTRDQTCAPCIRRVES